MPDVRQRVGAVGRDVDLEDLVEQAEVAAPDRRRRGASGDRIKIPSPASPMPSSTSLHSMPGDDTPADLLRSSVRPPGSVAPGGAQATLPPGGRHVGRAAHDLLLCAAGDDAHERSFSALGCGRAPRTSATTTPRDVAPAALDRLDLEPGRASAAARRCRR